MAKITIEELSGSLKEYLNGLGLTEAQVQELIDKFEDEKIGDISQLSTEEKGSLVGAINELFQSANNGKELIANAIGEPLNAEDTFSAMSTDINGLLSTFKTNMMNNGITVEANDKFKSLIDKIATMVEEGSNKGVQIASGVATSDSDFTIVVSGLNFKPFAIYAYYEYEASVGGEYYMKEFPAIYVESLLENGRKYSVCYDADRRTLSPTDSITNDGGFNLRVSVRNVDFNWIAYGIGEEDTTLRDSLASILQEEGVSVTEEDDIASLISKVDSEFTKDNNTINDLNTDIENTRNTLAGLMQEGGYDITGDEDINSLLDLLVLSGVGLDGIKQIACGDNYTMVLKYDGTLYAAGNSNAGQLGLGITGSSANFNAYFTKVTANINNDVKQVACGYEYTYIIKNDGSLWYTGNNSYSTFTQITENINNDVEKVYCGKNHTFIIKNDGSLWSCGYNGYGGLGLGDTTQRTAFTQVTTNINNDVKEVVCGDAHTFIIKNDGSLWACGNNQFGQLGLNNTTAYSTFTQVTTNINNDVKQVACGYQSTYILKNDGSLWSCGLNNYGQLGLNDTTQRTTITQVTANINNDVKQIACSSYYAVNIIKNDGSLWGCGNNQYGQLGLGNTTSQSTFTQVTANINNDVKHICCGTYHLMVIKNDGSLWGCGLGKYGQLGTGNTTETNKTIVSASNNLSF